MEIKNKKGGFMDYNMEDLSMEFKEEIRYLKLLAKSYPNIAKASTEIINLQAVLNLPKGTEHFLTDIHGEHEAFNHVLKNASGVIKRKIRDTLGDSINEKEAKTLATIIYYPEQKLDIVKKEVDDIYSWYKITIYRLVEISKLLASKYTRRKVRKAIPEDFEYIIEELLNENPSMLNKEDYYSEIIETTIRIDRADKLIIAISKLIQILVIDRLHIIGDIFDRGPGAHIVMDTLLNYHSVDIQWGNHDILWMGAASGSEACIANVLRISSRYLNLDTLEDGYGINLLPLATFALDFYSKDDCVKFSPKRHENIDYDEKDMSLVAKMHKAISIIQFKLEGQLIRRRPHLKMEDRLLLDKIDYENYTLEIEGKTYKLNDRYFPTIDPKDPYKLSREELDVIEKLKSSFLNSEKLQKHIRFLFAKGSIYLKYNSNLLYHGCIPINEDLSLKEISIGSSGRTYKGRDYLERLERLVREGYFLKEDLKLKEYGMDITWYLWNGPESPLFGRSKMTTFERYFIDDKEAHKEVKSLYYKYQDREELTDLIFEEFYLDKNTSHIINGHIPVQQKKGESPIRANGKLLVIDGGFSKAYQKTTGMAGYTLIYNSFGLLLASHEPFESTQKAIEEEMDILSTTMVLEKEVERKRVRDTDAGKDIEVQIEDLKLLLKAYRKGIIKEIK